MSGVRVIVLGNASASDDGAALAAARTLEELDVVEAGRPGPDLVDLLGPATPIVLVDVTCSNAPPGHIHVLNLQELMDATAPVVPLSSHGFGPAQALRLARALGRPLPRGTFVGIEGQRFSPGFELSEPVHANLDALCCAIRQAVERLQQEPD